MVAAIVIPILFLCFFIITKRERKEFTEKWLAVHNVEEEALLTGTITTITGEKQRYYYNRYIFVTDLIIKEQQRYKKARHILPITTEFTSPTSTFAVGTKIQCVGKWENDIFRFTHFKIVQ
jgi:hypothetical protein